MEKPLIAITTDVDTAEYQSYADAIDLAGGRSTFLTPRPAAPGDLAATVEGLDGLLLAGGKDIHPDYYPSRSEPGDHEMSIEQLMSAYSMECVPERDTYEIPLARAAYDAHVPILAICRGFQVFNVALGGGLVKDIRTGLRHRAYKEGESAEHPGGSSAMHAVCVDPNSRLMHILWTWPCVVNSRHHQGVTLREKAKCLNAAAFAPDGIVEALEGRDHPWAIAVQWHPERKPDSYIYQPCGVLFKAFVAVACAGQEVRRSNARADHSGESSS